ncbi:MAG TPA: serpin family protein [Gemmatales bacterium]|nr:serpin family protein [Gemmatales bacterium]HMP58374.1 serpin family protein [Gemmatales bacterium]
MKLALLLILLLAVAATTAARTVPQPPAPTNARAQDAFTVNLYQQIQSGAKGNLFFSPASLSTALTMAYGGARGETARQMAQVLDLPDDADEVHAAQGQFLRWMQGEGKPEGRPFQLAMANALWGQRGVRWSPSYLNLAKLHYGAGLREVDFKSDPEAVRREINSWVSQNTMEKIPQLLGPGTIHAEIRLVLTNAIYFKADWTQPFSQDETFPADFHRADGTKVEKPTMHQMSSFGYLETADAQVLELPYRGGALAMYIVLPKPKAKLADLEETFSPTQLATWTTGLKSRRVRVALPKFSFRASMDLEKTLAGMGMPLAFSKDADFTGLTEDVRLMIEKVIHQAYVAVDEKGTEAAAATGITMMPTSVPVDPVVEFKADRPFLFFIKAKETGTLLFLGRLMEP